MSGVGVYTMRFFSTLLLLALTGCGQENPSQNQPGDASSVSPVPFPGLLSPLANLPAAEKPHFYAGKALAEQPWVKAPTATDARDGLGPLYNARSCVACHSNGGRGALPENKDESLFSAVLRLSIPGENLRSGAVPEPNYGNQIQTQSISLQHQLGLPLRADGITAEAAVYIDWQAYPFTYPDGSTVALRKPEFRLQQLAYGALHPGTLFSLRNAPQMAGTGLLEAIPAADILALQDPDDSNHDGISGRANQVYNPSSQRLEPGRFGHKANLASVEHTVAAAFLNDIGINNPLFPAQNCTTAQKTCASAPSGNNAAGFELPADLLALVTNFTRHLGVIAYRQPPSADGQVLFEQLKCTACHQSSFTTAAGPDPLHGQRIHPYTDLLLHDMGPALADGRNDFLASGSEWRTAPLWGVGLNKDINGHMYLLHDGRAASVEEAILWHGGEASASRAAFIALTAGQRSVLLEFVESL